MWNRNIRVVIIPSIFAATFFGQSTTRPISLPVEWLISNFQLLPSAMWILSVTPPDQWEFFRQTSSTPPTPSPKWFINLVTICLALSLTVNGMVTGLIVFRIMKVYLEVKPTLSENNLGLTGGRKLRSIIFILIESGMALFAIQLGRLVLNVISPVESDSPSAASCIIEPFNSIQQMLNVIIGPVIFTTYLTDSLCFARA